MGASRPLVRWMVRMRPLLLSLGPAEDMAIWLEGGVSGLTLLMRVPSADDDSGGPRFDMFSCGIRGEQQGSTNNRSLHTSYYRGNLF